ncbi:P-loop containing nucleoside triphosphate hydrolase protein [Hypoxylon crocopeplum]|nr:P-loop containing nucleoside triphosphate hydrolase protein [Hypoxylon crocopeplum]
MAPSGSPSAFGPRLPQFLQAAHALVQDDELDTLHKTVTELATERGVLAVREMIDERILFCYTDLNRITLWRTCIRPLFLILTEPRVLRSVILEVHTGTIYNVAFGNNAGRLEVLFNFLINLSKKWQSPLVDENDGPKSQFLELCTAILAKMIDCNPKALSNETVPPIVSRLLESIKTLDKADRGFWSLQATSHLEYIQRRLGLVKEAPQDVTPKSRKPDNATFVMPRDLPGLLSADGPRHDNDFEDITKIRILPTMPEIRSGRTDYRPLCDPFKLHLPGIQGVIDRHFRLLREDMVGQLKESINEELQLLDAPQNGTITKVQNSIRRYSYNVADILDATCTRRCGLEFCLKIQQPPSASKLTRDAREDWWNLSKRLEIGALVCLIEKGTAVFCIVSESTMRPDPVRKSPRKIDENGEVIEKRNLYSNEEFAETDLGVMLRACQPGQSVQRSLVEFPGVLLPSFKPTLSALQQISKTLDLPFIDLLAPMSDGPTKISIPPPLYTTKPDFKFNLRCLTSDDRDLLFSSEDDTNPQELSRALLNALKRGLALIQGPPGTGKSYTGKAIIKVILANKKTARIGPILCVCYTNHALDQLLEHLLHGGVDQIIRIGSRSKSSILQKLNLRKIAKEVDRTKSEKRATWKSGSALGEAEGELKSYLMKLNDSGIAQKTKEHIKANATPFYDSIFGTSEDEWTRVPYKDERAYFLDWVNEGSLLDGPARDIDSLKKGPPAALSQYERHALCTAWRLEVAANLEDEFISLHDDYQEAKKEHDSIVREVDLRVLEEADIIGVTTTGLAKNLDMLRKLSTKVLLCEEAGEVLESHILTALLPSVEHAILIGDHLQLRPQVTNYELSVANPHGKQYALDISLFERLVRPNRPTDLKLPFNTLEIQRRMHPSISNLIRGTVYDSLQDAENVQNYPEVAGMRRRLFWFDHNKPESPPDPNHPTNTSRTNDFEVDMVCALLSHLVRQGVYGRSDIAVLTPYLGQLHKLRERLQCSFEVFVDEKDLDDLREKGLDASPHAHKQTLGSCLRLATVDNFQGEEAKVVVISLVRSNPERQCGFLRTPNRVNVLLSRAKHGMYIFGNSATCGTVEIWSKVVPMMKENGNIGTKLQLQCPRHGDTPIEVSKPDDFVQLSPEGGCSALCTQELDCGHTCRSKCHSAPLHTAVKCLEPCPRTKEQCGHGCPRSCGELCENKCSTVLEGEKLCLPCGHSLISPQCWQVETPDKVECHERLKQSVPGCKHDAMVPCHEGITAKDFSCEAMCGELLLCGHACKSACKTCRTRVEGKFGTEKHGSCTSICGRNYGTCRHTCARKCHPGENCPPCGMPCEVECCHSRCPKTCSEPCTPCTMATCSSACPHSQCTMPCAAPCDWIPCSKRCSRYLSCGHQCPSLCGEVCPVAKYCRVCASEEIKATVVDMFGLRAYRDINLDAEPCIFHYCGYIMIVSSMDGQMNMLDHYKGADDGTIIAITSSPKPFSDNIIKTCPKCKGSLRKVSRYGRIVRGVLLDESIKRFVSWSHTQSMAFEQLLIDEQEQLDHSAEPSQLLALFGEVGNLYINGNPIDQLLAIRDWIREDRQIKHDPYESIIRLYFNMFEYLDRVFKEERAHRRLHDLVEGASRSRVTTEKLAVDSSKIQTRGELLAQTVLFRCYLTVLCDFLRLRSQAAEMHTTVHFNLNKSVQDCEELISLAEETKYVRQEAEGRIFFGKLIAIARQLDHNSVFDGEGVSGSIMTRAKLHLSKAEALVLKYPSTVHIRKELDAVGRMLYNGAFNGEVSADEKRAVCMAISREFMETGHWYTCSQGHPFTVPMEVTRCPECVSRGFAIVFLVID